MNVLMLMSKLQVGGAETAALDLAEALRRREGFGVVVAGIYSGGDMAERFGAVADRVYQPLAANRFDVGCIPATARIIRDHDIDAIIIVDAIRNGIIAAVGATAMRAKRPARLLWCHGGPGHDTPGGRMPGLIRRLRRAQGRLDKIVTIAPWQRRALAAGGVNEDKMCVIPNGIRTENFAPGNKNAARKILQLPADSFLLVQVANNWPEKAPLWLLESFAHAKQERKNLQIVMIGREMDDEHFGRDVERLKLGDSVKLIGPQSNVADYLRAADAFVLATRAETMPISALEAMAAKLPVIAPDIPAFEEILTDGANGLKCAPGDKISLADCIAHLAGDKELVQKMGGNAGETAKHYDIETTAGKFVKLLRSIVKTQK